MGTVARSHWEIPCTDAVGRTRVLHVIVTRVGHISLIPPAGGTATVPPDRIRLLADVLVEARGQALRGAKGVTLLDLVGIGLGAVALIGVFRFGRSDSAGARP